MPKYEVHIFGKVPDCITVEADDEQSAIEMALETVMDELTFEAELEEEGTN